MKENILVIFGGRSVEHDISIITAMQVLRNMPKGYNVIPVYISQQNEWWTAENLDDTNVYFDFFHRAKKRKLCSLISGMPLFAKVKHGHMKKHKYVDCAVVCCHGGQGEGGQLSGMLELCKIPYTSCNMVSSAICMDKELTKLVLEKNKISTTNFYAFSSEKFREDKKFVLGKIKQEIGFPAIVKPARLGSSVGIKVASDECELESAVEEALLYDEKVIVERFVEKAKEFACAVMRSGQKILASRVENVNNNKIYTFEDKYIKNNDKKLKINEKLAEKIKKLAVDCYKALDCDGVVRVDFLQDESGKNLYVCEVNTIPGSLAFNLFDGVTFGDLIDNLVLEAKLKKEQGAHNVYKFSSEALQKYIELSNANKYSLK